MDVERPNFAFVELPNPNQERSISALNRLLAAGESLLAENAFEDAKVVTIAERAKSSVGSFYRLIGDKDRLRYMLLQQFLDFVADDVVKAKQKADSMASLQEVSSLFIHTFTRIYHGRRGVLRALILTASRDVKVRDRVHQLNEFISSVAVSSLLRFHSEIRHEDPKLAIATIVHVVLGALNQHTITGSLGGLSDADLNDSLETIFVGYLT